MNNGIYGLTKGQDSPTKEVPIASPEEDPLDVMMLGLSIQSSTFLARAITTRSDQLNELMLQGLNHVREGKGMALIEVLSPCVTYNDTYPQWMNKVYDVDGDGDYRNDDRGKAFFDVYQLIQQNRIPIGLIYHGEHVSLQSSMLSDLTPFQALDDQYADRIDRHMKNVMSVYSV